jgi:hypothetical protein
MMPKKKYKLHCFGCGHLFHDKTEVGRIDGKPYCGECAWNIYSNEAAMEVYDYEMAKWHRENPGKDYDEYMRDQAYIRKYGEC